MKKACVFIMLVLGMGILISCSSKQKSPLNPNGDSELALLMRTMEEDAIEMKKFAESGRVTVSAYDHSALFTATPTEAGKTSDPEYQVMAQSYLEAVKSMDSANKDNVLEQYHNLIDMCISCHRSMCPGPVVRIEKLYVSNLPDR